MDNPTSSGMLESGNNIFTYPCNDVDRTVPYFKRNEMRNVDVNNYLYNEMRKLH